MKRYTLHIHKDADQTGKAAAQAIAALAEETIAERGRFTLVLAGGSTPKRCYQLLARPPLRNKVDWSKVHFFWGDERPVPPDSPESNYLTARTTLLEPLQIAENQIHRMGGDQANRDAAAEAYQNTIADILGIPPLGEPPSFDLILLGMGDDGHTASLFPATAALLETQRWVVRNPVLKLESERLTLTPMIINRAAHIFFLVTGDSKADSLAAVLEGFIDTQRLPAQIIRPSAGNVEWFVDEAAAGKLRSEKGNGG